MPVARAVISRVAKLNIGGVRNLANEGALLLNTCGECGLGAANEDGGIDTEQLINHSALTLIQRGVIGRIGPLQIMSTE